MSESAGDSEKTTSKTSKNSTTESMEQRADRPIKDKWALVVGISKFKEEKFNLKFAAKDAVDFARFLTQECSFASDHVLVLTDDKATRANVLGALGGKWLPRLALPDDLVVLYFSTHGSPSEADVGGVNYLIAHDTDIDNLYASGIPMQELTRMIKGRVHSDRVVIMLDACHSGATSAEGKGLHRIGNFDAASIAQGSGQLVITSSSPDQRSWESKNQSNGVFTYRLIEALKSNGTTTRLGDAFSALKEKVETEVLRDRGVLQSPIMKSKWEGEDLVLAAPATRHQKSLPFEPDEDDGEESVKKSEGIDGKWDSNWGVVTLEHPPIEGDNKVKVTGYWIQAIDKNRGVIRSGTFDPIKKTLKFSYWQSWNMMPGKASFKLSGNGKRLEGKWKHFGLAGEDWIMWRKDENPENKDSLR